MRLALALLCAASTASAQPMTAEDFDRWSTGRTLDYYVDGIFWGSEQHLPDRQTRDSDGDGHCRAGEWFAEGDAICFLYQDAPGTHCWRFRRDGTTVIAEILGSDPAGPLITVIPSDRPLACSGPQVGV
jgi:hypothetical protein